MQQCIYVIYVWCFFVQYAAYMYLNYTAQNIEGSKVSVVYIVNIREQSKGAKFLLCTL